MKGRCYQPRNASYKNYGARGIQVCEQWLTSFATFLADMGERPQGQCLDRKDPDQNYTPDNCRWAPLKGSKKYFRHNRFRNKHVGTRNHH